ncbi:MAG: CoA-binding protein [Candidatus Helarchaeota archaeon]
MNDILFNPQNVAIIGATTKYFSGGFSFLQSLLAAKFPKERIFPINPKYSQVYGIKTYPNILDVPYQIDYCIIAVPKEKSFQALQDCVKKGVKLVCCFTSGFSEIGNDDDEKKLLKILRKGETRLLGPNCIGLCVPKKRIIFNQGIKSGENWAGNISIISQSGGNADALMIYGSGIGIKFCKAISYGNGIDINADEILEYLKNDPETEIIIEYLEGFKTVQQGRKFLQILRETTPKKPVIIWQGGTTPVGKRSILSHTGSVSGDNRIIRAAFEQSGAIMIKNGGMELLYTAHLISSLKKTNKLLSIGLNLGTVLGGGGNNVYFSDVCSSFGLNFPELDVDTIERLKGIVGEIGTLLRNPIDLNVKMFDTSYVIQVIKVLSKLNYIDVITFEPGLDWGIMNTLLMKKLDPSNKMDYYDILYSNIKSLVRNIKKIKKPLIIISAQTFHDPEIISKRIEFEDFFRKANIPVFHDIITMANAIKYTWKYKNFLLKDMK